MADERDDARRFEEIVAGLRRDEPGFRPPPRKPGRVRMTVGVLLCLVALGMLAFGGVKGAVLSVLPWLAGMACVLKGQG